MSKHPPNNVRRAAAGVAATNFRRTPHRFGFFTEYTRSRLCTHLMTSLDRDVGARLPEL